MPLALLLLAVASAFAQPSLTITSLPAYGTEGELVGQTNFSSPSLIRAHVYVFVPDTGWFGRSCPGATVDAAGSFRANVGNWPLHLRATKYAVLLWSATVDAPCLSWAAGLPIPPGGVEAARIVVTRANPAQARINFSGMDWLIKGSPFPTGPGPNVFSADPTNVQVDEQGRLHLRINALGAAEVIAPRSLGYGTYRVYLDTPASALYRNTVFGFFTWDEDPAQSHREIDIELSRWDTDSALNAQFVVQPYTTPGNMTRFVASTEAQTAYEFVWMPDSVKFTAIDGHSFPATLANTLYTWTLQDPFRIPTPGSERVRLNLYRYLGQPGPTPQEMIVRKFEFLPPAPITSSRVAAPPQGMTGWVRVDVPAGAPWKLNLSPWIHALPTSGTGPTVVWYSILPNFRGSERSHFLLPGNSLLFDQPANTGISEQRFAGAMYYNFLGRVGAETEVDFQVLQGLFKGLSRTGLAHNFFNSEEFNLTGRFVAGLYVGLLNRDPEHAGWLFQRNALSRSEVNHVQLVENFLNSPEYQNKFGSPTNEQFVRNLYQYVLGRQPNAGEIVQHVLALETGTTRAALAAAFLNVPEFRARNSARLTSFLLYATILQRDGTPAERDFWAAQLNSGVPLRTILDGILASEEFRRVFE